MGLGALSTRSGRQDGYTSFKIANSTVSRTWPVQVIRSSRIMPSRTAELGHRLAGHVAAVYPEFDASVAAVERVAQHHVLGARVGAGAAVRRSVIGVSDFERLAVVVNVEVAAHSDERLAVIERERDPGPIQQPVEALVEMLGRVADVVDSHRAASSEQASRSNSQCASVRSSVREPSPAIGAASGVIRAPDPGRPWGRAAAGRPGRPRRSSRRR